MKATHTPAVFALLLGGLTVSLLALYPSPVVAQDEQEYQEKTTGASSGAARASERARQARENKQQKTANPPLFPASTRLEPPAKASVKGGKALQEIIALYDAQDFPAVMAKTDALGATDSANAYDKGFAYQIAANAASDAGDDAKAIEYFQKALQTDGLGNNDHYQVMYSLAAVQYGAERYPDSLATLERFLAETKADKPEYLSLKAALLNNLDRGAEAAALYEQLLTKSPDDKKILMNAVSLYQQADNFAKANALLLDAQKRGLLTEPREYRALYIGYINDNKLKEALALIDEGIAKGVIKPSPELANDYSVIGQYAYGDDNTEMAIEMFKRAAPMAKDGEAYLNLAKVYINESRVAEAKAAAQQALAKGVKRPEEAKKILAQPGK